MFKHLLILINVTFSCFGANTFFSGVNYFQRLLESLRSQAPVPVMPDEQNSSEPPWCKKTRTLSFPAVMVAADLFLVQVRSKLSILPCHLERYKNLCKGRQGWCLKHFFPRGTVQPPHIMSCHLLGADHSTATRAPTAPGAHRPLFPQSSKLFTFPLFFS